ncbi:hypothetical protein [Clostridium tertium]|uniref:hypothetical protein n=1 Tax=Clostridium tertium TaxID=1559 RepID=UPI0022E46EC9|nr:hypothetical protein [Clostridium tertium]
MGKVEVRISGAGHIVISYEYYCKKVTPPKAKEQGACSDTSTITGSMWKEWRGAPLAKLSFSLMYDLLIKLS